jgi:hypothetical protein
MANLRIGHRGNIAAIAPGVLDVGLTTTLPESQSGSVFAAQCRARALAPSSESLLSSQVRSGLSSSR